jgi:hypothetical protein
MLMIYRKKSQHAKFLRQGIQLTGLESEQFQFNIDSVNAASDLFARHLVPGKYHPWIPDKFMTYPALNIYNRYFYSIGDCTGESAISFSDTIDPEHLLSTMGSSAGLIHTTDNQVEYFKMTEEKKYLFAYLPFDSV